MRILLLEDEPISRKHMVSELRGHDNDLLITECRNLRDVEQFSSSQRYDAAFLDIRIGKSLDGLKAADILRSNGTRNIVFMTAYSSKEIIAKVADHRPVAYITKPFNTTQLVATVDLLKEFDQKGMNQTIDRDQSLEFIEKCLAKILSDVLDFPNPHELTTITKRLEAANANLFSLRRAFDIQNLDKLLDDLCIILYAMAKIDHPQIDNLLTIAGLAVDRVKLIAQSVEQQGEI